MSYIPFLFEDEKSRLRITLRHYVHKRSVAVAVALAEQSQGHIEINVASLSLSLFSCLFPLNLLLSFPCYWHFLILFFAIDSYYFSQSSFGLPSHSPLFGLPVSHFVAICRQTLLDWPLARTPSLAEKRLRFAIGWWFMWRHKESTVHPLEINFASASFLPSFPFTLCPWFSTNWSFISLVLLILIILKLYLKTLWLFLTFSSSPFYKVKQKVLYCKPTTTWLFSEVALYVVCL